ncbi:PhoH family protein [Desulfoplanes sp.]
MKKTFVLDTNVLIENPECIEALRNGQENDIILPYTVLLELDRLKKNQRLSHIAAKSIRIIQADTNLTILPPFSLTRFTGNGDDSILEEIRQSDIVDPILVTNDRIMQIKARLFGITCEDYRDSKPFRSESQSYTGIIPNHPEADIVPNCFQWDEAKPVFHGPDGPVPFGYQHTVWGVQPRNIYQNMAFELMLHPKIDLVSVQSEAGYGKTFLALAAALQLCLQDKDNTYRKIYLVKPPVEIGEKMGFLPGDIEDKMEPYIRYIRDLVAKLHDLRPANRIFDNDQSLGRFNPKKFEILPIAYIRGMNIENAVTIIDEMQNVSRMEARSLLTRMGQGVKCFCLGDTRQVDNPYLNEGNNGLNWVVKKLKGMDRYAHIVLKGDRSRGPITDMVLKAGL